MEEEKSTVSFAFSKKIEKKIKRSDSPRVDDNCNAPKEFVTSLEDRELKGVKPDRKPQEYVIPLITKNKWRSKNSQGSNEKSSAATPDEHRKLDSEAVKELLDDAAKRNESWDDRGRVDQNLEIPMLLRNKVPEGFETDDKLDVSLRPDEPEEADYDQMPISQFGFAMLRGMGWKDGEGIGKNKKTIAPLNAVARPKGLGLGADRSTTKQLNDSKTANNKSEKDGKDEKLQLKKGAHCLVLSGPNRDMYGTIEGIDEDNTRVMVKLALSSVMITVSQFSIKVVSKKEFDKESKYLNKAKVDKYKEEQERKKERSHRKEKDRKRRRLEEDSDSEREEYRDNDGPKRKDRERREKNETHRRSESSREGTSHKSKSKHENGYSHQTDDIWVHPNIRVRIIDKNYKKGKYYNEKVEVIDVATIDCCICRTDDGKLLEDISQSNLETLIPKKENSLVLVVKGKHRRKVAEILDRNKKKCVATVQILPDKEDIIKVDFDSICEYVGNIHETLF